MIDLNKKRNIILIIIAAVLLFGVVIVCAIEIGKYIQDAKRSDTIYESLAQATPATVLEPEPEDISPANPDAPISFQAQFKAAYALNSDVAGWVHIPNTNIDYPILAGSDNIYYLKHNMLGETSARACIMMDNRTDKNSKNIVLYGHNMRDNTMFHDLMGYKEAAFYNEHPLVYLQTESKCLVYRVFAVYIVTAVDKDIRPAFSNNSDFSAYISHAQSRALYQTGISVAPDDRLLTLTTCTYEIRDANLVVLARLE